MIFQTIHLKVEVYVGSDIPEVIREMIACANHLQMGIWADLNGVKTLAKPGDNPDDLYNAFSVSKHSKNEYKYASCAA